MASCRIGKRSISLGVDYKVCPFFVFFYSVKSLMTSDWEEERSKELFVRIGSKVIKTFPTVGGKAESLVSEKSFLNSWKI